MLDSRFFFRTIKTRFTIAALATLLLGAGPAAAKLVEEITKVPVKVTDTYGKAVAQDIVVTVFFEDTAPKPYPVLVLNHGRAPEAEDRAAMGRVRTLVNSRWLAQLGFMVAVPTRVGYGVSGGEDVEETGECRRKNYPPGYAAAADETLQVLEAMRQRPDTAKDRAIIMGQSFGGATAIKGLPYLNLINAISKGDGVGMATAAIAILAQIPEYAELGPVGWVIAGVQIFLSLIDDDTPDIHGGAQWAPSNDGRNVYALLTAQGADGGGGPVMSAMTNLLAGLQTVIHSEFPQADMGLIASRLPWLSFSGNAGGGGEFTLHWKDSHTGETYARRFSAEGDFIGVGVPFSGYGNVPPTQLSPQDAAIVEVVNSPDFFKNMGQQFVEIASGNLQGDSAVVQAWQSQTALAQASRSDPLAGLNTEQRARAQGIWLGTNPGNATLGNTAQSVHPIVLDLDNNGISITTRATGGGVMIDVDDDGFAEETDWLNPRDGILVLDKNADGQITGGAEMFNDAQVNMAARGLNALQALDADGDNKINASDFAFSHLQVWQDINHDGVAQSYELASLASKGITELNIGTGRFVMGGVSQGMQAMGLNADSAGFITQDLGNSLMVVQETGGTKLLATALADYGQRPHCRKSRSNQCTRRRLCCC